MKQASLTPNRLIAAGLACILCALAVAASAFLPNNAFAVTAAEKQAEAEEALQRLNAMQDELDRLSAEYGEAMMAKEAAEKERDAAYARVEEIQVEIEALQGQLGSRVRDMYRTGSGTFIEMLLGSTTFVEFATNWDLLNKLNQNDSNMLEQEKALKEEAEGLKQVAIEQAAIADQKALDAQAAEEQAMATVAEMQTTYETLSAEAEQLLEEERKAAEEAERQRREAEEAAARAAAASPNYSDDGNTIDADGSSGSNTTYEGGSDVVSRAYACLGAPYVWGAVGPYGYDCSGLVSYCLSGSHTRLGTTYTFMGWDRVSNPQPGDICTNNGHCGIYIGNGQMIHAATFGVGVIIGPVQSGMIYVRY
jgi:cell wall-associated NlpC family hydrolase